MQKKNQLLRKLFVWLRNYREAVFLFSIALVIAASPLTERLLFGPQNRVNFLVRQALNLSPPLSERIKVIAFDDITLAKLGRSELKDDEWISLIKSIVERAPRAVVVDKIFATGLANSEALRQSEGGLTKAPKLIVGSFVSQAVLAQRDVMPPSASLPVSPENHWIPVQKGRHYGPEKTLLPFVTVGHFDYKGEGFVETLIRPSEDRVVPHLSLLVADQLEVTEDGIRVDGSALSPWDVRHTFVNFLDPAQIKIRKQEFSLFQVLKASQAARPISFVQPGDTVFLLPQMFTGNTDFKSSPIGDVPGGYVIVSMVQSVLSGSFIRSFPFPAIGLALLALIALLHTQIRRSSMFGIVWLTGTLLIPLAGLLLFAIASWVVPWMQGCLVYFCIGAGVILGKQRLGEQKVSQISHALSGLVSPSLLSELIRDPARLEIKPSSAMVTVMFVDVVGFSVVSETRSALEVFELLRKLLQDVSKIVHDHGGVIDKTMGDGLMCFFGYRFSPGLEQTNHAEQALKCAIEIQYKNALRCASSEVKVSVVLPMRIGLNSGPVYIGNLGDKNRIDFSLIGHAVNYAKRLEDACEPFRIMIGLGTQELLSSVFLKTLSVEKRYLNIKHHSDLWEGYELDPFTEDPSLFAKAVKAYREFAGEKVKERRWTLDSSPIPVMANSTIPGTISDFSRTGLSVFLPQYLALKVQVSIDFPKEEHSEFRRELQAAGVTPLICEVRWGRPEGKGYRHGLLIKNLTDEKRDLLIKKLKECAQLED